MTGSCPIGGNTAVGTAVSILYAKGGRLLTGKEEFYTIMINYRNKESKKQRKSRDKIRNRYRECGGDSSDEGKLCFRRSKKSSYFHKAANYNSAEVFYDARF